MQKQRVYLKYMPILCISGNTQFLKIKIFNRQTIVLFYTQTTAFVCRGGGGLPIVPPTFVPR